MKARAKPQRDYIINCDGCSPLYDLAQTSRTEVDAARQLITPLAKTDLTIIDLNIGTTGRHRASGGYKLLPCLRLFQDLSCRQSVSPTYFSPGHGYPQ